jgi:hypothetical protein
LDRELQKYYEDRFTMMSTEGWKQLMEDVSEIYNTYNKISGLGTAELDFRKGQLDILNWLLSLHDVSAATYKELSDEEVL